MPKRIAVHTIIINRDGKRVKVAPGKAFDFTTAELADIKKTSPDSVRIPVNEVSASPTIDEAAAAILARSETQAKADAEAKIAEAEAVANARMAEQEAADAAAKAAAEKPANNGKQGGKNGGKNAPDVEL